MPGFFSSSTLDKTTLAKVLADPTEAVIPPHELPVKGPLLAELLIVNSKNADFVNMLRLHGDNAHQLINVRVYIMLLNLARNNSDDPLLKEVNDVITKCNSPKHKALLDYVSVTMKIATALEEVNRKLKNKVMQRWTQINLDELFMLNMFLKLNPTPKQIETLFHGGLFAVKDKGLLYDMFVKSTNAQSREHDCSHRSMRNAQSFQGKLVSEFLFGDRDNKMSQGKKTNEANTGSTEYSWFQMEYSSIFGLTALETLINWIKHKIAFLIYAVTQRNVGPYGTSEFKEGHFCELMMPDDFQNDLMSYYRPQG